MGLRPATLARHAVSPQPCISCLLRPLASLSLNPALSQQSQARQASILSSLKNKRTSYSKAKRRGRGPSSGKGKTSGRGMNGQGQHGKVPAAFQGGETPLEVAKGLRGFYNRFALDQSVINTDNLQRWIDAGRLDITRPVTVKELHESRLAHSVRDGIKLLARGGDALRSPVHITVSRASKAAIAAVEKAGGTVTTRYYTRAAIKRIMRGETHPTQSILSMTSQPLASAARAAEDSPESEAADTNAQRTTSSFPITDPYGPVRSYRYRLPDAFSRRDVEYYRDSAYRGYLSYQVQEGQLPSLYYKAPPKSTLSMAERVARRKAIKDVGEKPKQEGKMW